jgi:hypothetical protein
MYTKLWSVNLKRRALGRPRHKWEGTITIDLRKIGWELTGYKRHTIGINGGLL